MNILVIGSGGREHALAWQCAKDDNVQNIYVAPGNAGTALEPKCQNVTLESSGSSSTDEHSAVIDFCKNNAIDMVIVGPEAPLVTGIVDACRDAGIKAWGPTAYCAQLEGSKTFAKEFMESNNIPTAAYQGFTDAAAAKAYIDEQGAPIVIKADGLAAGKGVIVAETIEQAHEAIDDMLADNKFGDAGSRVVIEQFLQGEEASFICMIDGENILPMATSQDHKRAFEGDTGPNTGGMGAYSPAPVVTQEVHEKVMAQVIQPVVDAMNAAGHPYTGFLYAGLMIDDAGDPYVIEFNCRFGDPETQPILMRLQSSMVDLVTQGLEGRLPAKANWDERPALGIVVASKGYPETSSKGDVISGLPELDADNQETVKVFHAGTAFSNDHALSNEALSNEKEVVTNGGRVLCVTALADNISDAQQAALAVTGAISFDGAHYRRDIGHHAITREDAS
ncbi:phosphoribosylamine--glycine ligase [Psychrobacter sp. AOP22-C1-22]|uniref:phosphoribosylamine--glycine ligase n=1 Tax=unclassified Psychrobacter TaxID=196806 RepID=UPI001787B962|nr:MULTISPECIES: phosphoribosylamine--glycine ligase [unclassified Psychrobacter]MDN5800910.1 phosphoribosylamine--glycine ligase [Psychrobacter sp.]MBE0405377.1 phosphoribosylamine--glycine ligase [Psychrobacter sp. FME6]MBE0443691.1 phosphoribosylamine--glycine ligase [Psychrobacter sp. FME5]MDN5891142.1 phosphoribosylamine--glycine ligase [Psychrobacter sp.]MDN5897788.1 phosphoribosylamine--glycine ligase [Psychrobacter sp.]